jgi:NADH-quinone oxidoreductase subunit A
MGASMLLASRPNSMPASAVPAFELTTYYPIFLYLGACILIPAAAIIGSYFVGPRKSTAVKLMPYESGMDPIGDAMQKYDVKFYLIAILFLVFDVELLFLYPWAVLAYGPEADPVWKAAFGRIVFIEMLVFIATLVVAYVYAWRKGVFQWR